MIPSPNRVGQKNHKVFQSIFSYLNLYLKTPDPLKKKSVNSDNPVQRKHPKCGPISTNLLLSEKDVNFIKNTAIYKPLGHHKKKT